MVAHVHCSFTAEGDFIFWGRILQNYELFEFYFIDFKTFNMTQECFTFSLDVRNKNRPSSLVIPVHSGVFKQLVFASSNDAHTPRSLSLVNKISPSLPSLVSFSIFHWQSKTRMKNSVFFVLSLCWYQGIMDQNWLVQDQNRQNGEI